MEFREEGETGKNIDFLPLQGDKFKSRPFLE